MANKKLNAIIQIGGGVTGSLKGAFGTLKSSMGQIGGAITDLSRRQKELNKAVNRYGAEGRGLGALRREYAQNARDLDRLTAAQQRLNAAQRDREENGSQQDELKGKILGTVAATMAVAFPIRQAIEFESTMAEIKKVVNPPEGADSDTFFKGIARDIMQLSNRIPMTANQLGQIYASAGQAGIATTDLTKFVETAAKMGVAFDISAEQAGQSLAEMKSAFNMTLPQVAELADKINYLGNNSPAAAQNIMEIVQRIGPLGGVANVASGEIAAMGATLRGMGVQNEIAATGIKNLMLSLTAGSSATKSQRAAFKQLGFTSKQVARSMQLDSTQTMMVILKRIGQMKKTDQTSIITQLFGKEVAGSIAPLITQLDALQKNMDMVGRKGQFAGSMEKEFAARAKTTANNIVLLKNRLNNMAIVIGSAVLPVLNDLIQASFPYLDVLAKAADEHPQVSRGAFMVAGGLVAMRIAALGAGFAWTTLRGYMIAGRTVLAQVRAALLLASIAARGLSLSLMFTPVGAAIAAVTVVVAGLGLAIWKNWDAVKAFTGGALTGLWKGLEPVREMFGKVWDLVKHLAADFGITGEAIGKVVNWFKELFTPITHTNEELKNATAAGETFGRILAGAINVALIPLRAMVDAFSWLDKNVDGIITRGQNFGKGAINKVKGWFTRDREESEYQASTIFRAPGMKAPPAPAAMATGRGGSVYHDNSTTTIQVTQNPGESASAFAQRISELQRADRERRARSGMQDKGNTP